MNVILIGSTKATTATVPFSFIKNEEQGYTGVNLFVMLMTRVRSWPVKVIKFFRLD